MNNLYTSINSKYIFGMSHLSYHTKCILLKIITDFIYKDEPLDFLYLEESIFDTWSNKIAIKALDELVEGDIMYINLCDCGECEEEGEILFNPNFIEDACPYIDSCPCCNPAPTNFNVNYN